MNPIFLNTYKYLPFWNFHENVSILCLNISSILNTIFKIWELLYFSRLKYMNHLRRRPGPLDLYPRVRSVLCCFSVAGNKTGPQMNPQTQPKQLPGPPNLNGCKIRYPLYQITTHSSHKAAIRPNKTVHRNYSSATTPSSKKETPPINLDLEGELEWRGERKLEIIWLLVELNLAITVAKPSSRSP